MKLLGVFLTFIMVAAVGIGLTWSQTEPFSVYVRNLPPASSVLPATDLLPLLQSGNIERSASPALINSALVQNNSCVIDNVTYAGTMAGIQAALNNANCKDIYVPAGTFTGTALLQINRSNVKLHGAGGASAQPLSSGAIASTILSSSCFNPGANPVILIGDGSPTLTYGGVEITDMALQLPATCNMIGVQVNTSTPDVPNALRRMRITQGAGTASGTGVFLGSNVYNWTFEDDVIDRFAQSVRLSGGNNLVKFSRGMMANGSIGINHQNSVANESGPIVVTGVDFENFTTAAIDLGAIEGAEITNNYFGQGSGGAAALAIRLGAVAAQQPRGVTIAHNLFNAGGISNYAIELNNASGFFGVSIRDNYFLGHLTNAVHNLTSGTGSFGYYSANTLESVPSDLSATNGFINIQTNSTLTLGSVGAGNGTLALNGNVSGGFTLGSAGTGVPVMSTPWPVAAGGTNCAAASGTCLDNITGFAGTGPVQRTGAGAYSFATLPVTSGGTGDTGTAWTTFTASPSCGTATFNQNSARWKTLGKTMFVEVDLSMTAVGTCGNGPVLFTIPFGNTQGSTVISGFNPAGGRLFAISCFTTVATSQVSCDQNAGTAYATNDRLIINGSFEQQ